MATDQQAAAREHIFNGVCTLCVQDSLFDLLQACAEVLAPSFGLRFAARLG